MQRRLLNFLLLSASAAFLHSAQINLAVRHRRDACSTSVLRTGSHPLHRAAAPSRVVRQASDIQAAFKECQAAAELFPAGSNERQVAGEMIAKLEGASMASWNPDDMQLLDSCLVDEGSEACVAFSNAMTALRELREGSPGNA